MKFLRSNPFRKLTPWIIASPLILLALAGFMTNSAEGRARHNVAFASVAALKASIGSNRNLDFDAVRIKNVKH